MPASASPERRMARGMRIWGALLAVAVSCSGNAAPSDQASLQTEGLQRSQAAATLAELTDTIGARLTWSPNFARAEDWAEGKLKGMGLTDVHREEISRRGPSWRQRMVWVRMTSPDQMMLIAQAAPWSASSKGVQRGTAVLVDIATPADVERYRGRLRDKVVLLGGPRAAPLMTQPLATRLTDDGKIETELQPRRRYYAGRGDRLKRFIADAELRHAVTALMLSERPRLILTLGQPMAQGGDTGLIAMDEPALPARGQASLPGGLMPFPIVNTIPENYNRLARLVSGGTPVSLEWQVATESAGIRPAHNIIADIPGTDPALRDQVVLVGAHLDSWSSGTGATDNGAGVATVLEAVRLLRQANFAPRRTIRVILYAGEEQGLLGAESYAERHLGGFPRSAEKEQTDIPVLSWRRPTGPFVPLPEWDNLAAVINIDDGGGRARGVFTAGGAQLAAAQLQDWLKPLAPLGVARVLTEPDWPADQSVFSDIGVPAISFLQDPLDYFTRTHHTNMDTFDRIVPEDLAINAVTLATVMMRAANDTERLPREPSFAKPRSK